MTKNIIQHNYSISKEDRNKKNQHQSLVVWFTGLSGSGKSTMANRLEKRLFREGISTYSLDGDNIRSGLNKGLGFSREDRHENNRRIAEVAKLFVDAGIVTVAAFISPLEEDREQAKDIIGKENFVEVFVNTPLEVCEERDVKGFYEKARKGEIKNFTGISSPYEPPENPDFEIKTVEESAEEAIERLYQFLQQKLKL
ncbi:adenylyl-sulfate kinase [Salinimicrobium tongyeongense]|jgi:adenylylsulfate kinase|uniref:Adenylyl-sulfate kinase n=1 Tax=Salinimicrobium tongyeongense TaxID=2809707 RepID=A0ABY6NRX9_9FLAO|nr:adenylyl-sulfate kinase [Salinimicrobium tongyeongense]UZH55539.1 adenylyl-sulfate kinase [Salinimicrobium tongyeongense]